MKLFALFLVFSIVFCACCKEMKKADVKMEKKDIKTKLADLSKVKKRAKDYNAGRQNDYSTQFPCRDYGEPCIYNWQCCGQSKCIKVYHSSRCRYSPPSTAAPDYDYNYGSTTNPEWYTTKRWVSFEEYKVDKENKREEVQERESIHEEYRDEYGKKKKNSNRMQKA